jgi:putative ABC transport system permease protein
MKFLSLVWSSLKRKKLRTSLTLLSIIVAFVLYGMLCTLTEAFTAGVSVAGADRLVVHHKTSFMLNLPETYARRIASVRAFKPCATGRGSTGSSRMIRRIFFASMPTNPEEFFVMHPEYVVPAEQKKAWLETRTGAIVGRTLADRMEWKIGDRIPLKSPIWRKDNDEAWVFDIVGIYDGSKKSVDTSGFFFRYDYFDEGRPEDARGKIGWLYVRIADPQRATDVAKAIDGEFANSPYETKTEPEGAMMQGFISQMGSISTILIAILSAVFFTILLVAGNTMAQSVRERTEELGTLKALGFSNGLMLALVLVESCLLTVAGGLLGIGLAWLITAGGSPVPQFLPVFYLPERYMLIGVGLALGVGFAAGIIPAVQAMRLQIAVALRRHA